MAESLGLRSFQAKQGGRGSMLEKISRLVFWYSTNILLLHKRCKLGYLLSKHVIHFDSGTMVVHKLAVGRPRGAFYLLFPVYVSASVAVTQRLNGRWRRRGYVNGGSGAPAGRRWNETNTPSCTSFGTATGDSCAMVCTVSD